MKASSSMPMPCSEDPHDHSHVLVETFLERQTTFVVKCASSFPKYRAEWTTWRGQVELTTRQNDTQKKVWKECSRDNVTER